jgi:Protein of unknown function (DUF3592)
VHAWLTPLAVQISNGTAHPVMASSSGLWGIAVVIAGMALSIYGVLPTVRARSWQRKANTARAQVVDALAGHSCWHRRTWIPVVEFTANDVQVRSAIDSAATRRKYELGRALEVLYSPNDPHDATLATSGLALSGSFLAGITVLGIYFAVTT